MPLPCPVCAELRPLADAVGCDEATLRLVERFGGTWIYVPRAPRPSGELARAVGPGAAAAMSERLGGARLYVPLARYWLVRVYDLRGESTVAIARKLRCTAKAIAEIRRGWRRGRAWAAPAAATTAAAAAAAGGAPA